MAKCKQKDCGKEFNTNSKKALYCSPKCRQKAYRESVAEKLAVYRASLVPLPKDYIDFKKIGVLKEDGTVQTLKTFHVEQSAPQSEMSKLDELLAEIRKANQKS